MRSFILLLLLQNDDVCNVAANGIATVMHFVVSFGRLSTLHITNQVVIKAPKKMIQILCCIHKFVCTDATPFPCKAFDILFCLLWLESQTDSANYEIYIFKAF